MNTQQIEAFTQLLINNNIFEPIIKRLFVTILWDKYPEKSRIYPEKFNSLLEYFLKDSLIVRPQTVEDIIKILFKFEEIKFRSLNEQKALSEKTKLLQRKSIREYLVDLIIDNCGVTQLEKIINALIKEETPLNFIRNESLHFSLIQKLISKDFAIFKNKSLPDLNACIENINSLIEFHIREVSASSQFQQNTLYDVLEEYTGFGSFFEVLLENQKQNFEDTQTIIPFKSTFCQTYVDISKDLLNADSEYSLNLKFIIQILYQDLYKKTNSKELANQILNSFFALRILNSWLIDTSENIFMKLPGGIKDSHKGAILFLIVHEIQRLFDPNKNNLKHNKLLILDKETASEVKLNIEHFVASLINCDLQTEIKSYAIDVYHQFSHVGEIDTYNITANKKYLGLEYLKDILNLGTQELETKICLVTQYLSNMQKSSDLMNLKNFNPDILIENINAVEAKYIDKLKKKFKISANFLKYSELIKLCEELLTAVKKELIDIMLVSDTQQQDNLTASQQSFNFYRAAPYFSKNKAILSNSNYSFVELILNKQELEMITFSLKELCALKKACQKIKAYFASENILKLKSQSFFNIKVSFNLTNSLFPDYSIQSDESSTTFICVNNEAGQNSKTLKDFFLNDEDRLSNEKAISNTLSVESGINVFNNVEEFPDAERLGEDFDKCIHSFSHLKLS